MLMILSLQCLMWENWLISTMDPKKIDCGVGMWAELWIVFRALVLEELNLRLCRPSFVPRSHASASDKVGSLLLKFMFPVAVISKSPAPTFTSHLVVPFTKFFVRKQNRSPSYSHTFTQFRHSSLEDCVC